MRRLFVSLLAIGILIPGLAASETKVDVASLVRIAGCNEFKVTKVAELRDSNERVYVAWCAALTNYLRVVICKQGQCQILEPQFGRSIGRKGTR